MEIKTVFKRYEFKYMLTYDQKRRVLKCMESYMQLDDFGKVTIRNVYFDTDTFLLIRRSLEKPAYKEKLRIRSYEKATESSAVFVELKKKYNDVVYKRRISLIESEAMNWVLGIQHCRNYTQIASEVDYVLSYYKTLRPTIYLSYEREAFYARDGTDFRVTFDENILARQDNLSLKSEVYGTEILPEGMILMEIKCSSGIPLWMVNFLSREHIYKTSYSKYGMAYQKMIYPNINKN